MVYVLNGCINNKYSITYKITYLRSLIDLNYLIVMAYSTLNVVFT